MFVGMMTKPRAAVARAHEKLEIDDKVSAERLRLVITPGNSPA